MRRFRSQVPAALLALVPMLIPFAPAGAACPASERGRDAVVAAVVTHDVDALAALIDAPALATRVLEGLPDDDEFVKVMPGVIERTRPVIAGNLIRSLTALGSTAVEQRTSGRGAVVRKQGATLGSGVDYVEFSLGRDGCIVDWTSLMLGTSVSRMVRQNLLLSRDDAGLLASLFGVKRLDGRQATQMRALADALRRSDHVAALAALDGMKALARESFELSMLRVGLLAIDHEAPAYREALADIAERFGDDERAQFMLVDHYFYSGEYAAGLHSVENLQQRVGEDEENTLLRATMLRMMTREGEAIEAMRRMIALAPARAETHGVLVAYLAELGRSADAVAAMQAAAEHGITFDEAVMRAEPAYAQLLASPEYAAHREAAAAE